MTQLTSMVLISLLIITSNYKNNKEPQGCNCHCRIGFLKKDPVREYPNPVIDIGIVGRNNRSDKCTISNLLESMLSCSTR